MIAWINVCFVPRLTSHVLLCCLPVINDNCLPFVVWLVVQSQAVLAVCIVLQCVEAALHSTFILGKASQCTHQPAVAYLALTNISRLNFTCDKTRRYATLQQQQMQAADTSTTLIAVNSL